MGIELVTVSYATVPLIYLTNLNLIITIYKTLVLSGFQKKSMSSRYVNYINMYITN